MKATEAKFLEFLKKSPQFVIPIYRRTYLTLKTGEMELVRQAFEKQMGNAEAAE